MAQDWRPFDLIGIAIGRAQAQYPLHAMLGIEPGETAEIRQFTMPAIPGELAGSTGP